jgi:sugar phosphate isomerase/epimerase
MTRTYSLAYLTSNDLTPPQALRLAAELGYAHVGLRLQPNAPGAPHQALLGRPEVLRETLAAQRDCGVGVFDLEIVRIGPGFDPRAHDAMLDAGAALQARAVLVAGDDPDPARLAEGYARLCERLASYGMSADLEFMPWTAVPDARSALRAVRAAGSPRNAGVLVDALHFGRSDTTLADLRALPREWLHYAQICDAVAGTHFSSEELIHTARSERRLPGEGTIALRDLFAALPQDLPVSVEIVDLARMARLGTREWARRALAASRAVLDGPA